MTVFLEDFDIDSKAILEPSMLVSEVNDFPKLGISCFSKKLHDAILEKYGGKENKILLDIPFECVLRLP